MRPRIFITQPVARSAIERLRGVADVDLNPDPVHIATKDELLDAVRTHDILFCLLHDRVDGDVIGANPGLKAVASMKITPSDIAVEEATRRRIPVTVIPPIVTEATADLHMALLLAVARRVVEGDRLVRSGVFPGAQSSFLEGVLLAGKVLGLIGGGGRIGRAVARRARGFGMKLIYWSPRRKPEGEQELGLQYVPFDQLLAEADFVSVHTPLTPETRHQIGTRELALMKPTAFIVNTARGPIIDESALARALVERRIAGAGLDVFENEPHVEAALLMLPNVVLTPHLGSAARELREVMANVVVDNIMAVLEGRQPPNCWNAEIYAAQPADTRRKEPTAMPAKAKVVLTDYVWESLDVEKKTLEGLAELVPLQTKKPEEFIAQAADCDALLNTYAGPITAEVMARMPKCRIIARYGIGVDTIDLEAATRAGIIVTNNPTYCIEEVAEHAMALLLAAARKVAFYDRQVRAGRWEVPPGKPLFRIAGRTLGLVGFGNIARQVAVRAASFGMRVLFADPFISEGQFDAPGKKMELDDVLREADFISLHPPLTPQTRKMISDEAFSRMKPTAVLINCARGPIVDTEALVRALDAKKIGGCALDTTDPEPLPDPHPLRGRENVILNPHVAWYSEQALVGLQAGAPNEVRRVLSGEWPVNVVNRAVKGKNRAGL